ncbi:binding-protein-dependent transport system inner membrane protein [Neobacillus bataviensis LMG 21833]|uniref:Binding-protein-dependent transport system inner membrane protein n=1 Tax=Neobacillus bataviensis LMG 21833 TaxID=1117379 RepID=K6C234_9BACI|nr:carbohydrate ABC transporter permease [Neobacillus bataviensis]EKN65210.1 binding-protein-dependent transport system inner membrane protein [Neobacillus bataviensis LMG 21833]
MQLQVKQKLSFEERKYFIRKNAGRVVWALIRAVIIFGICFVILQPLLTKLSVSLMTESDLYDASVVYIAREFTMTNFKTVFAAMDYGSVFFRTLGLSLLTSLLQLISCTIVGYGFARFKFPFKNTLFMVVIFCLLIPPQTLMLPLFFHFRFFDFFGLFEWITGKKGINLLDTLWPFILTSLTAQGLKNGLYIFLMRQYFSGMPNELEEAAYMDGCGVFKTFYKIMLPSAVPMMMTILLFGFVWQWTDNFYSNLYLSEYKVMANSLGTLASKAFSTELSFVSPALVSMINNTGTILVIIPLFILYFIAQRYFVESIERSGIVG